MRRITRNHVASFSANTLSRFNCFIGDIYKYFIHVDKAVRNLISFNEIVKMSA